MTCTVLDLACFKRNSMLTVDATITGLDGEAADITALTGDDIRWALARSRRGPRLATLNLTNGITKTSPGSGLIRIQYRPPLPPADPDPFRPGGYWQECEVDLPEAETTQFYGPVRIEPSMFAAESEETVSETPGAEADSIFTDVTLADLADKDSDINALNKFRNKLVVDENERVWRAIGLADTSPWRAVDDPAGIEEITPA